MAFIFSASFRFKLALWSLLAIIAGMFVSRAMMSIGMILIGLQFFLKPDLAGTFRIYYKDKVLSLLSLVFLCYLLTIFYTEHKEDFWPRLSIKLPLLFMPLGFAALKEMSARYFQHALYFFLLFSLVTAAISVGLFITNYEVITENYKHAKVIPNIFNISHIRFSLMLVIAVFSAWYLYAEKYWLVKPIERYLILGGGIFILGFVHLLSVRSGLLAFYASCFVITVSGMFLYKKYLLGAGLLLLILLMPLLAYYTVPTIQNKVYYMALDVSRFFKGKGAAHWSDGNRLLSIQIGIELGNEHPLTGLGIGDVEKDMSAYYLKNHSDIPKDYHLIPHNQFVYVYTACGIIGLAVFLVVTLYPFFLSITYRSIVFLTLLVSIFTSYLSEATLENQLGVCLFITFYLIGWACKADLKTDNQ